MFALSSFAGGLATTSGVLIGARLAQGAGAAMMMPAALSILTTSFAEGKDRNVALGAWGGTAGIASAFGVFFGGVLTEGPGWRWVLFVNPPICVAVLVASFVLLAGDRREAPLADFDVLGALLATGGMLLLVFALVQAPDVGWGTTRTIAEIAGALLLLGAFVLNEQRRRNPLLPLSIFKVRGLAAADATQLIAVAGFIAMFFFLTLYMQNVLGYSPLQTGAAYLPVCLGVAVAATVASQLLARTGTRVLIVGGMLMAAAGVYLLSRIPVDGSYVERRAAGDARHVARSRRRVRRGHDRRERRCRLQRGGARRRAPERVAAGRRGARARDLHGDRHLAHERSARGPHAAARRPRLGVPARAARELRVPGRGGDDRSADAERPQRRVDRRAERHPRRGAVSRQGGAFTAPSPERR